MTFTSRVSYTSLDQVCQQLAIDYPEVTRLAYITLDGASFHQDIENREKILEAITDENNTEMRKHFGHIAKALKKAKKIFDNSRKSFNSKLTLFGTSIKPQKYEETCKQYSNILDACIDHALRKIGQLDMPLFWHVPRMLWEEMFSFRASMMKLIESISTDLPSDRCKVKIDGKSVGWCYVQAQETSMYIRSASDMKYIECLDFDRTTLWSVGRKVWLQERDGIKVTLKFDNDEDAFSTYFSLLEAKKYAKRFTLAESSNEDSFHEEETFEQVPSAESLDRSDEKVEDEDDDIPPPSGIPRIENNIGRDGLYIAAWGDAIIRPNNKRAFRAYLIMDEYQLKIYRVLPENQLGEYLRIDLIEERQYCLKRGKKCVVPYCSEVPYIQFTSHEEARIWMDAYENNLRLNNSFNEW